VIFYALFVVVEDIKEKTTLDGYKKGLNFRSLPF
jgi:hypothetical protein